MFDQEHKFYSKLVAGLAISFTLMSNTAAYAAIPAGTVIFSDGQALDLGYANNSAHTTEVMRDLANSADIYVKNYAGQIINNTTGAKLSDLSVLPEVTYKDSNGNTSMYEAGDGPEIATVTKVDPLSINTTVGTAPILPTTVTATMSDGTTQSVAVTWDNVDANQYAAAGTFTVTGTITNSTVTVTANITVSTSNSSANPPASPNDGFKTLLDSLVTSGTITQTQEDAIQSALAAANNPADFTSVLDGLVSSGTITKAQEETIKNALNSGDSNGSAPGNPPGSGDSGGSSSGTTTEGTAVYTVSNSTETKANQTYSASEADKSCVKATDNGNLTLSDSTVTKTGDSSSMDNSSFYGLNAAVLAESGGEITFSNSTVDTNGSGANGVFATGTGSTVNLSDVTINCTATGSHGVDATLGGTLNLNNVNIATSGNGASAAIATDRGGGTINTEGGTVTTTGTKSPGIYSTGDITVSDATIKTSGSEAVVIEGKNSTTVNNCTITAAKNYGVFIYQSFSGDAETGTGNFTMNGGSINATEGPMFYSTNTDAVINLKDATITADSGTLLQAGADQWGTNGSNGANVIINADSESLNGNIILDNISTANLNLQNNTSLKGTLNKDNTAKSVSITLDKTSTWNATGTSYITSLTDADSSLANIISNGNTIYYDSSVNTNSWLAGKTISLADGGTLTPVK